MKTIRTRFYSELEHLDTLPVGLELLVTDIEGVDIDKWVGHVKGTARAIIPPYDIHDPARTSRCADMARQRLDNVGVVVAGKSDSEREQFFLWAQENKYAPIVLLPHRQFNRQHQIMQLAVPKYIKAGTWIHLPEPVGDFNPDTWPGRYTTGEEFRRLA